MIEIDSPTNFVFASRQKKRQLWIAGNQMRQNQSRYGQLREYSTQEIKQEIIQHKKNCAAQEQLEAQFRRDGTDMPFHLIQRLSELKMHNEMVKSWLSLLSEDEEYVIRRHLIHELTWPRLETEYQSIWKEYGKERRTLMRYQKNALERIYRFIQDENSLFDGNER